MTQNSKGPFVMLPFSIIYGETGLNANDIHVLTCLMGKGWEEGKWYPFSYRDISAFSRISLSLLCSSTDKKTGVIHEGCIDRLARPGYISMEMRREIDPLTGQERGKLKMHIRVNFSKIWQENVPLQNEFVPIQNNIVLTQNNIVPIQNEVVPIQNKLDTDEGASDAPREAKTEPPIYIDTIDKTDNVYESVAANADNTIPPPLSFSEKKKTKDEVPYTPTDPFIGTSVASKEKAGRTPRSLKQASTKVEFTPEGRELFEAWCTLFKTRPATGPKTIQQANELVEPIRVWAELLGESTAQVLTRIRDHCYKSNPTWFRDKGVRLCNIHTEFEGWQSVMERQGAAAPASSQSWESDVMKEKTERQLAEYQSRYEEAMAKQDAVAKVQPVENASDYVSQLGDEAREPAVGMSDVPARPRTSGSAALYAYING